MGKKWHPHTTFSRKKWNGVPVLAAKNSTPLPKMELLFILKKVPVLAAYTMTIQFEAKVFDLHFSDFCTTAKPFQLFADFLTDGTLNHTAQESHCIIATF